jgi:hypothetical protein
VAAVASWLFFPLVFVLVSFSFVSLLIATASLPSVAAAAAAVTEQMHANESHEDDDVEPIPGHMDSSSSASQLTA